MTPSLLLHGPCMELWLGCGEPGGGPEDSPYTMPVPLPSLYVALTLPAIQGLQGNEGLVQETQDPVTAVVPVPREGNCLPQLESLRYSRAVGRVKEGWAESLF